LSFQDHIADIPEASQQDVEEAILSARRAFDDGAWAKMTGHERQKILTRASAINSFMMQLLMDLLISI
jgi:acyl-CoA reductase-like NAD-dependent aldehyde dehydrogenase